ncbi:EamA family transporter [Phytomonospora endophytica]|uniref:Putative blue pigment (Indigoidine) exporter n=1 Tax=Phytomonospora endophytica TaxID=714109 RepID=A0A841FCK4_9ACTN|nr:EamA family transporter [Phytomonospora endophytica]MBB6033135.1 putative blue pigment (indigoidine) exporter [Phytomonospora endophytica]GIG65361.1 ABC transporter permease [Phytomonospora endophytica]
MVQAPARTTAPGGTLAVTALTAAVPAAWGTTYLVTTEFLPPGYPLVSGVLRALPAGLVLLAVTRRLPRGVWLWRSLVLGTLNIGALFALLFVAAYRLPGGVAATLTAVQPLFVVGLAFAVFGEKPTRWRLGWGLTGVVGVGLIVLRGRLDFDALGVAAGLAAAAVMAAGIVLTKRWGRPEGVGPTTLAGWQLTAGGLVLLPLALAVEGLPPALDLPALGGYAWLAVVGAGLSYPIWFRGIGRLPVVAVSFLALLSPVVATVLGWVFLGQSLTAWQGAGFVLALSAISAAQLTPEAARGLFGLAPKGN